MKKILSVVLALCMLVSLSVVPAYADEAVTISQMQTKDIITIMVDGVYVDCAAYGQMPVIVEGRTLVPLRSVFEALGATVEWENDTRSVKSVKGNTTITLRVDSKEMTVNSTVKTLDVPAQLMNDRTMVPVRAVAEAFGCTVSWNNDTRTVVITTQQASESGIPVVNVDDAEGNSPTAVVQAALDAIFALDFEKGASFYKNPEAAIGEYAGITNVSDIVNMFAGEDMTEEQLKIVEEFTLDVLGLVSYEITGMSVVENTAEVYVTIKVPDFENMDMEAYLTEDAILMLYEGLLAECGYTLEDLEYITDEAEIEALTNVLVKGMFDYIVAVIEIETETAGYIVTEEVENLELIDGKWLIVE